MFKWLCVALCLFAGAAGGVPAHAQTERSVTDWIALANEGLSQGRVATAIAIFGEIAARHPGYQPAEAGLKRSLAQLGSVRHGEAFLRYALEKDPKHERAFLAAWQVLDRTHPLRFSASASILPSNNVEHVASERYFVTDFGTFLIDQGGQATPGVGLGVDLNFDWIIHPRPDHRFLLRAGLAGAWYRIETLRYGEPSLALRYEHLAGTAPWSLEGFVRDLRYGGTAQDQTSDNVARGATFAKAWRMARGRRVDLKLGGEYRDYSKKHYLTGPRYSLDVERSSRSGKKGRVSFGLNLERALPRTDYHRYVGVGLRVGYGRPLRDGLWGGVTFGVAEQVYDTDFPTAGERRRDRSISLGLSARLDHVKVLGQVPKMTCTARRTLSNIALYTTNSVDCAMALTVGF